MCPLVFYITMTFFTLTIKKRNFPNIPKVKYQEKKNVYVPYE